MKKDHLRDYATHAFREYAAAGCPTYDQLRYKLIAEAMASSGERLNVKSGIIYKPTEAQIEAAERQLENAEGYLHDLKSVASTIEEIKSYWNGEIILSCLKAVYFTLPKRKLRKGEISERVRHIADTEHICERTVFNYLDIAREVFSKKRKLNTGEDVEKNKFLKSLQ